MTDEVQMSAAPVSKEKRRSRAAHVKRRYAAERRFRMYGVAAILTALGFLVFLFASIVGNGWTAFQQTKIGLDVTFDQSVIDPKGERKEMQLLTANYQ